MTPLTTSPSTVPGARLIRGAVAALIATLLALAGILLPSVAATAADIPGAITHVSTDKTSYGYNERIKLTFDWAVPDTASAGDTFSLTLPDELKAATLARFSLLDPDGAVVAEASWVGKTAVFTLTDYVDTHDNVGGNGFFSAQWDHEFTPETSGPIVLQFGGNAVEVTIGDKPTPTAPCTENCPPAPTTPTSRSLSKGGGWADGAYEGTRDETGNINWSIALPGSETGFAGPITIVDTPQAGSINECATIVVNTQPSLAGGTPRVPVDPSRYTVDCAPESFTVNLDAIAPSEFITISYKGTITDQRSGVYGNHVEVTIAGTTTMKESTVKRTDAGGIGGGTQSVSVGDYVWLDNNRDGIQDAAESGIPSVTLILTGPAGDPVTDIDGQLVPPTVTDADGHYTFDHLPVLSAGQHYTVTIDQVASATALKGLVPTTANAGGDRAVDSSTKSAESVDLVTNGARDATLDFGFVRFELPTLPFPEPPTAPQPQQLAYTGGGSDAMPFGLAAAGLLVLGLTGVLIARRRRV